ncbi:phosphatase PAP2 family protein [Catenuloplanes atrovinosus]|uniref:Membrane-associated phospholipid phosphatase n=1 Tax=Catenuloplanes atrovinosus TaxID=137266 RepID=A0AAE3YUY8_9ACTN|nr:phosphatase PAP2 family protein [Catenuloplanes atrovinosus]MDR7280373.1 membrane-associated phospholipid phosphatase [Catenuloplanes atrovinosus]
MRRLAWWFDGLLVAAFAGLTALLAAGHLLDVDLAVSDWAFAHQPAVAHYPALALNYLGQGGPFVVLCTLLALWLGHRWRDVRPIILVAATYLLAGVVVAPLKEFSGRDAPRSALPNRAELFNDLARAGYDWSYPSGHMVNAFVWFFTLLTLLTWIFGERVRRFGTALRVAPPIIVFGTTVYLNYHWLTDSIAGLLIGLVLVRLLERVRWRTLPLPAWVQWRGRSAGAGGAEPAEAADQHRVVG